MASVPRVIDMFFLVRQIPVFSKLNWMELRLIASKSRLVEFKKGETVYRKGEEATGFYCVISGRLFAYALDPSGQKVPVEYMYRGMHFGIISLLTGERHSLTFEALNDTVLLTIPKADFKDILSRVPKLGVEFSYSLSRRIKNREVRQKSIFESTVISVYGSSHGVGSSSYAFNLAYHLQRETQKRVLFVDVCLKEYPKSFALDMCPRGKTQAVGFSTLMSNAATAQKAILPNRTGVDFLPVQFDDSSPALIAAISPFISNLANDYHFVVVDLPNHMDDGVLTALLQSDEIHLVTSGQDDSTTGTRQMLERLTASVENVWTGRKIKVIVSDLTGQAQKTCSQIAQILKFPIYGHLPHIREPEEKEILDDAVIRVACPKDNTTFAKAVRRVAREIGAVRVGLVLGGGAAFGLAHIGVLQVLEEAKVPVDIVVGSSVGALIAGMWCSGMTAPEIERSAFEFHSRRHCLSILDPVFPHSGLVAGSSLSRWLRKKIGSKTFYDVKIPLRIVAYDLAQREELVIDSGDIVDAVHQSTAIPGVVRPVVTKGRVIIDGGIVNPLATNVLSAMGIRKIIAVNVLKSPQDVAHDNDIALAKQQAQAGVAFRTHPVAFLKYRIARVFDRAWHPNIFDVIVNGLLSVDYVLAEKSAQYADVLIHPSIAGFEWYELFRAKEIIQKGREAAETKLEEIQRLVKEG